MACLILLIFANFARIPCHSLCRCDLFTSSSAISGEVLARYGVLSMATSSSVSISVSSLLSAALSTVVDAEEEEGVEEEWGL